MPTAKLCVIGLQSAGDERRVEMALCALPGVFGAVADRTAECVEIDYEDDVEGLDRLIEVVQREGFGTRLAG